MLLLHRLGTCHLFTGFLFDFCLLDSILLRLILDYSLFRRVDRVSNRTDRKENVRTGINRLMGCVALSLISDMNHIIFVEFFVFWGFLVFSINKNRKPSAKIIAAKQVAHRYNFISSQRMAGLRQEKLKKKTESKMNWGIDAYRRWRETRIRASDYNADILSSDIDNLDSLTAESFSVALCYFIPEVVKLNDELYPAPSLYQLVVAIQKYLNFKKINWKIIEGPEFCVNAQKWGLVKERESPSSLHMIWKSIYGKKGS